jgi:hypothetical protein
MRMRTYRARTIAAAGAAAALTCTALTMSATTAAQAATSIPTVTVHMSSSKITFIGGGATTSKGVTTLHAGRYHFHVVTAAGDHTLQLLHFRRGYSPQQAQQDFNDAFNGNVPAVQRIDKNVVFRGGADATPKHAGDMVATLGAMQYMAVDQNGNAASVLSVVGKVSSAPSVAFGGTYTAYSYGWGVSSHLPKSGYVRFINHADQPHFLVLQHVKSSTTNAMVSKYVASGSQQNPPWGLKESADAGVVSPNHAQLVKYSLPAGKYLVACFWPDYFTGMPHFMMGMWKLVTIS